MHDDELKALLEQLPRQDASAGFTGRVMKRLDEPARPRILSDRRWAFAVVCAMLITLGTAAVSWRKYEERREATDRLHMMRSEYRALELELEELRMLASDAEPVLELSGSERVDFLLDLRTLAEESGRVANQPTSHSPR